jgi:hypothetical protein
MVMTIDENTGIDKELRGLGGWLILIGIGVVLAPFLLAFQLYQFYLPFFQSPEVYDAFNPSSESYVAWLRELVVVEVVFNIGLFIAALFNLYGYFRCKRWFPKLYQTVLIASAIFLLGDAWFTTMLFPNDPSSGFGDKQTVRDIGRSIGQAIIWVPYMQLSKRVRNTFVN